MSILSLAAITWDIDLYRWIHIGLHRDWLDKLMLLFTYTGDGHIQIPLLLAACVWKKTRPYGLAVLACYVFVGGVRLILRDLFSRPRPTNLDFSQPVSWGAGMPEWLAKTFDIIPYGDSSFPSGHSATSFAVAFMLAWLLQGTKQAWFGWLAVVW